MSLFDLMEQAKAKRYAVARLTAVRITGTTRYEYDVDMKNYRGQYNLGVLRTKAKDYWPLFAEETETELASLATKITPLLQFCLQCGAGVGSYRREGEGTCPDCPK